MHRNEIKAFVKIAAEQAYRKQQLKEFIKQACYMDKSAQWYRTAGRVVAKPFVSGARALAGSRIGRAVSGGARRVGGGLKRVGSAIRSPFSKGVAPGAYFQRWKNLHDVVHNTRGAGFVRRYWDNLTGATGRRFADNFEGETLGSIAKRFNKNAPVTAPATSTNYWINKIRPTLTSARDISNAVDINNLASVAKQLQRASRKARLGTAAGTAGVLGGLGTFYANR